MKRLSLTELILVSILASLIILLFVGKALAQSEIKEVKIASYTIKKGDTLEDLMSMFGQDIVKINPEIRQGIKEGQEISYQFEDLPEGKIWGEVIYIN